MSFLIDDINASDIDGLVELLSWKNNVFSTSNVNDIINLLGATRNSIELGINLDLLIKKNDKYTIDKGYFKKNLYSMLEKRRKIIFDLATINTNFLSSLLLCSPRGIIVGGSKRITQILSYAGLLLPLDKESERWWLELRWFLRKQTPQEIEKFGNIGDLGGLLSMNYEKNRLNGRNGIERVSVIDGDIRGFDILSFVDINSDDRKRIEVKASSQKLEYAKIHISWNEWNTAKSFGKHEFHLWPNVRSPSSEPIIITVESLHHFVPITHKNVEWNSIIVPMKVLTKSEK